MSGGAASYDPANNRWTKLDTPPDIAVEKLIVPTMVWSGREVVLLGGPLLTRESGEKLQGAALDPVTGTWRALPDSGLSRRIGISAAWAGSELLVWGGAEATGLTTDPQADGARYRPGPDR